MEVNWRILYRGSLDSCNYSCSYCPFAKHKNTREELQYDKECLLKFKNWVANRTENISLLITPWGEALIRTYYQEVMAELSQLAHVKKIVIQTNLSCSTKWLQKVNKQTFALWITYHPGETQHKQFINKINDLIKQNIQFSIGVVGKREHFEAIQMLQNEFPQQTIWVNAYKDEENYYQDEEIELLTKYDQFFPINLQNHQSLNQPCAAGETSFSVNHLGDVFPCHFIKRRIGNIYEDDLTKLLKPTKCINSICDCYIGYMNLKALNLEAQFGTQILERIPLKS